MKSSNIKSVAATGDIVTVSSVLREVVLSANSDAASAVVRAGGSGGTVILTLRALTGTTAFAHLSDVLCSGGIHVTITGTSPACAVTYC